MVAAPPQTVFDLLADPARHPEIDGSDSLRQPFAAPERLSLGAHFGMRMRLGLPYPVRNTVVEFEEGRRIAWRHFGRHVWRYELEPVPGGTKVTEVFDWSVALSPLALEKAGYPERNTRAIEATLDRLAEIFGVPQESSEEQSRPVS